MDIDRCQYGITVSHKDNSVNATFADIVSWLNLGFQSQHELGSIIKSGGRFEFKIPAKDFWKFFIRAAEANLKRIEPE